jgi:hypothetical protein
MKRTMMKAAGDLAAAYHLHDHSSGVMISGSSTAAAWMLSTTSLSGSTSAIFFKIKTLDSHECCVRATAFRLQFLHPVPPRPGRQRAGGLEASSTIIGSSHGNEWLVHGLEQ